MCDLNGVSPTPITATLFFDIPILPRRLLRHSLVGQTHDYRGQRLGRLPLLAPNRRGSTPRAPPPLRELSPCKSTDFERKVRRKAISGRRSESQAHVDTPNRERTSGYRFLRRLVGSHPASR